MQSGWYLMYRGWQDSPVFKKEPYTQREAWEWLISEAAYENRTINIQNNPFSLRRGQLSHSVRFLATKWMWNKRKVEVFLTLLKKWDMIETHSDVGQTVITLSNYCSFQDVRSGNGTANGKKRGQRGDSKGTKNKEGNEFKEGNEITSFHAIEVSGFPHWLPIQLWDDYCVYRGKSFTDHGKRLAIAKLERWRDKGHCPKEIIETSIMNGWKGLYEPKEKQNHETTRKPSHAERLKTAGDEALSEILTELEGRHVPESYSSEGSA